MRSDDDDILGWVITAGMLVLFLSVVFLAGTKYGQSTMRPADGAPVTGATVSHTEFTTASGVRCVVLERGSGVALACDFP